MSGPDFPGPDFSDDDALLDRLRSVVDEVDPVPREVTEAAFAALATRRLDDELAELVADSEVGSAWLVRNRTDNVRLLSFESAAVSVELQLTASRSGVALRGLVSGAAGEVTVETPGGGVRTAALDGGGWFTVHDVAPGLLRLRLQAAGGAQVVTSWVSI